MKTISEKQALSKAMALCCREEKCTFDIRKKLISWKLPYDTIDNIIDKLLSENFIEDKRYAEFFVRDKFRFNKWGKIKIAYHLRQKQFSEDLINIALNEIKEADYMKFALNLIKKKHESEKKKENDYYKLKAKLYRFAQSRGLESDISLRFIDEILHENRDY